MRPGMRVMACRALLLSKNIVLVEIRCSSRQKGLLSHDMAVCAQAGGNGAYTRLVPGAVAEVALIARLHVDVALILYKGLVERQWFGQLHWCGALLAQQRMTGMTDSLLVGSEKLRVFGSVTLMTEIAIFQH